MTEQRLSMAQRNELKSNFELAIMLFVIAIVFAAMTGMLAGKIFTDPNSIPNGIGFIVTLVATVFLMRKGCRFLHLSSLAD